MVVMRPVRFFHVLITECSIAIRRDSYRAPTPTVYRSSTRQSETEGVTYGVQMSAEAPQNCNVVSLRPIVDHKSPLEIDCDNHSCQFCGGEMSSAVRRCLIGSVLTI